MTDGMQSLFEREMRVNLECFWRPEVVMGLGRLAPYQEGGQVFIFLANAEYLA
jgi:hypothetical protein